MYATLELTRRLVPSLTACLVAGTSLTSFAAHASGLREAVHAPSSIPKDGPAREAFVLGGREAPGCEWPAVADLNGCSATLLSPEILVYAAHCGTDHRVARFGGGEREVELADCFVNPAFGEDRLGDGLDWAYCRVADPQQTADIPVVAPIRSAELQQLEPGFPVTLVGYGVNDLGLPAGSKVEVDTLIRSIGDEAWIGGDGADTCQGDSGGPAFVQMPDRSWRVLGITSYGGACGRGGYYTLMSRAVDWIESHADVELPNCEDSALGGCEPGALDPGGDYGSWETGCEAGPVWNESAVDYAEWTWPRPGQRFEPGSLVFAELSSSSLGVAAGLALELQLDGQTLSRHERAQGFAMDLEALHRGQHVLRALWTDERGDAVMVARRAFRVDEGDIAGDPMDEAQTDDSAQKADDDAAEADAAPSSMMADRDELGCSVAARPTGLAGFVLLCLAGVCRRRRQLCG